MIVIMVIIIIIIIIIINNSGSLAHCCQRLSHSQVAKITGHRPKGKTLTVKYNLFYFIFVPKSYLS